MPTDRPLTLQALNRATLARQMLLAREKIPPLRAIERLVAMQAQLAKPPFVGLWSRLEAFRREDLARLLTKRDVVRATSLRGTLHLMTAKDYVAFRPALQPMLSAGSAAILKGRTASVDVGKDVAAARAFFAEAPRPFNALRTHLKARDPKADERAIAYMVRTHLPLVQVPTDAPWSFPATADFTLADAWLGEDVSTEEAPMDALLLRYFAAFGPATVTDAQAWLGFRPLRGVVERLRPKLRVLHDDRKRELFDVPKGPLPDADTDAPVRFLPEFDNLLLSHVDRTRFIADAHRRAVYLPGLRVAATILVDGLVAGTWTIARAKKSATLRIAPFAPLAKKDAAALTKEGDALLRFAEEDATAFEVRIEKGAAR